MDKNIKYRVLGLMSGTSLDGVDLVVSTFTKNKNWNFIIEKKQTIRYSDEWRNILECLHNKNKREIKDVDLTFGRLLGNMINHFLDNDKVDFISSHGHTIFHQPDKNYTLQIGCGKTIAKITNTKTINNFRKLDVSLKGQGAPLVPIGDLLLFPNYTYCLNLGGFANISIKNKNSITAFDICPVNIVLNNLSSKLGFKYDFNGDIAKKGKLIKSLLNKLDHLSYYKKKPPKSLGSEWVQKNITPLLNPKYKTEDILNTFCEHIGKKIGEHLNERETIVSGGGVFNKYLFEKIKKYSNSKIIVPEKEIIEFKEALIFGLLGILRVRNEVNCLKSVTGASKNNSGGLIHYP